ncbi:MAG: DUF1573 domain-containing protein, partial [bacterium]
CRARKQGCLSSSLRPMRLVEQAIAFLVLLNSPLFAMPASVDAARTDSGPAISCGSPVFDFGQMDNENAVDHSFVLRNAGSAPLKLDKIVACCGSKTELSARDVAPGASVTLQVHIPLKGRSGDQSVALYVRSNDRIHPLYELIVRGKALAKVEVRPTSIMFGALEEDAAVERTVSIICNSNVLFNVTNVVCNTLCISAAYVGVSNGVHRLLIRTVPPLASGITRAIVYALTDHERYGMIEVPVLVRVSKDIVVFPQEICIMKYPGKLIRDSQFAVIKSLSKTPFTIVGSEVPEDGIELVWNTMVNGGYRVEIRNLMPIDEMNGKQIILKTDNKKVGDVAIPIRVIAAPQQ